MKRQLNSKSRQRISGRHFFSILLASMALMFSYAEASEAEETFNFLTKSSKGFGSEVNRDANQLRKLFALPARSCPPNSVTSAEPSGRNAILQGSDKPLAKVSMRYSTAAVDVVTPRASRQTRRRLIIDMFILQPFQPERLLWYVRS